MDIMKPRGVIDAENNALADAITLAESGEAYTPRERAALRGWNIDPALTPGNPHDFGACMCRQRRLDADDPELGCSCPCHGRSVKHYRRGS